MSGPADVPADGRLPWLLHGMTTCVVWFVAFLALDDITTGQQPTFAFEHAALAGCAGWLLFLSVRLAQRSHPVYGALSLAAVLLGAWAVGSGMPYGGPQYVALFGAFCWFTLLALALFWLDWCPPSFRAPASGRRGDAKTS